MRITQRAVTLTSLTGLNRNLEAVGRLQEQLTSGRLINAPSDSPTGTHKAMQTRAEMSAVAQQGRNISDAKGWMEQTGSTLLNMLDMTRRVRDLTVQGASTGSNSPASLNALSIEVSSLREGLLDQANTAIQGRPLFGGVTTGSKAYGADGAYVGTPDTEVKRRLSGSEFVRIDITGPEAFRQPGAADDLFAIIANIAGDLPLGDGAAMGDHLAALDGAIEAMTEAVAHVGARASRVERAERINMDRSITLQIQLGETENVDLPNAIMKLQMQQVGYEAALAATAKTITPTLLDYLR